MKSSSPPSSSTVITIGELSASLGEVVSGEIPIPSRSNNATTTIPITLITGVEDGPTLLVLAGIHGSEYPAIAATQRLANDLDPKTMKGAVILVHIANLPAYLGRSIYINPIDGKNLNRVFPGNPYGSVTERTASFLVETVYPWADAVMDMHSGDANEQLRPSYTAYYGKIGSPEVIQQSKEMAYAFGVGLTIEFPWELPLPDDTGNASGAIWAGSAAVAKGIPSIDVEMAPGMGLYDPISIELAYQGILRVMEHLGSIRHEVRTASPAAAISLPSDEGDRVNRLHETCLVTKRYFIDAPTRGSWVPVVDAGTYVMEGTLLGYTTDLFGRERTFEAVAPSDGLLLIRFEAPPVEEGDTLVTLAVLNTSDHACLPFWKKNEGTEMLLLTPQTPLLLWQLVAVTGWCMAIGLGLVHIKRSKKWYRHTPLPTIEVTTIANEVV